MNSCQVDSRMVIVQAWHCIKKEFLTNLFNKSFLIENECCCQRYKGFTLAEVLITLAIIGIVATLTIPTLMNKINDMQFKQGAKKAYSEATQAILQMQQDQELTDNIDIIFNTKQNFMKHFNVIDTCGDWYASRDCVGTSDIYKNLTGETLSALNNSNGEFVTKDGMFWALGEVSASGIGMGLIITVDVNSYQKPPNTYGQDTFMFEYPLTNIDNSPVQNSRIQPMGAPGTIYEADRIFSNEYQYCDRNNSYWNHAWLSNGYACSDLVLQGIDY